MIVMRGRCTRLTAVDSELEAVCWADWDEFPDARVFSIGATGVVMVG